MLDADTLSKIGIAARAAVDRKRRRLTAALSLYARQ